MHNEKKRKQKSTSVEIKLTIPIIVKPVKETVMEEKTMTNKVTVGEVVIVRRPHTQQVKLYWYGDVDEAFDA